MDYVKETRSLLVRSLCFDGIRWMDSTKAIDLASELIRNNELTEEDIFDALFNGSFMRSHANNLDRKVYEYFVDQVKHLIPINEYVDTLELKNDKYDSIKISWLKTVHLMEYFLTKIIEETPEKITIIQISYVLETHDDCMINDYIRTHPKLHDELLDMYMLGNDDKWIRDKFIQLCEDYLLPYLDKCNFARVVRFATWNYNIPMIQDQIIPIMCDLIINHDNKKYYRNIVRAYVCNPLIFGPLIDAYENEYGPIIFGTDDELLLYDNFLSEDTIQILRERFQIIGCD